jgi:hypothetical protein
LRHSDFLTPPSTLGRSEGAERASAVSRTFVLLARMRLAISDPGGAPDTDLRLPDFGRESARREEVGMQQSIEVVGEQVHGEFGIHVAIAQLIHNVRTEVDVDPGSTWALTTAAALKLSAVDYASITRVGRVLFRERSPAAPPRLPGRVAGRFAAAQ